MRFFFPFKDVSGAAGGDEMFLFFSIAFFTFSAKTHLSSRMVRIEELFFFFFFYLKTMILSLPLSSRVLFFFPPRKRMVFALFPE